MPRPILAEAIPACSRPRSNGQHLKTRVSMMDNRLIEMASRMPLNLKFLRSQSEWLRRDISYPPMPKELIERPNAGFEIPLPTWSCGPFRCLAGDFSRNKRSQAGGYFQSTPIKDIWLERSSGKRDWQHHSWTKSMRHGWAADKSSAISRSLSTA